MTITLPIVVIILAYILWLSDFIEHVKTGKSNLFVTGILITLVSWEQNVVWGVIVLIITVLLDLLFIALTIKKSKK